MTDTRTFDEKMADPEWRARQHEVLKHVANLMRMTGAGQVVNRRLYLEALQAKDAPMGAQVAFSFDYHWRTAQEAAKGG